MAETGILLSCLFLSLLARGVVLDGVSTEPMKFEIQGTFHVSMSAIGSLAPTRLLSCMNTPRGAFVRPPREFEVIMMRSSLF